MMCPDPSKIIETQTEPTSNPPDNHILPFSLFCMVGCDAANKELKTRSNTKRTKIYGNRSDGPSWHLSWATIDITESYYYVTLG